MQTRTNEEWLADLRGPDSEQAIIDLRATLLRGLRAALSNRLRENLETISEDFVQEALIKILDNLDTFRGESRFTTWAQKIAVHVAYTELRRRRWRNISLQDLIENQEGNDFTPAILTDPETGPEEKVTQRAMLRLIQQLIDEELTERQRTAMKTIMLGGMPISEAAERMGTNRNALYKLLHDARKRLQRSIKARGFTPQEILAIFER